MKLTLVKEVSGFVGRSVTLAGWVYNQRSSGKISFLQFRDGTGFLQLVMVRSAVSPSSWQTGHTLTLESSVRVTGLVKKDPRSPSGYEIEVTALELVHLAPDDYPIGKKSHGPAFLLDHRHLWVRSPKQRAILKLRALISRAIRTFYHTHSFTQFDTPIFTPVACEGTTTLFSVDYFGHPAYLSQSGQLYLEAALPVFNRVYDFQPVFRAEKSKTRRHLIEFWMSNAEMAFFDHEQNITLQEQLISFVVATVLETGGPELALLQRDTKPLEKVKPPFDRLTHQQAVKLLRSRGSSITSQSDLGAEDETLLGDIVGRPVFIEYFPASVKAFYMKRADSDPTLVKCADLIAPEGHGEIIGGSEREADYEALVRSLEEQHLSVTDFGWYLDLRRYGSVPHSGFGIGLERLVKWIADLAHVRETIPFPRLLNRLSP